MQIDKNELETFLISEWWSTVRPFEYVKEIHQMINFRELNNDALILLIDIYLKDSWSTLSWFSVHIDTYELINIVRNILYKIKKPSKRLAPILRCYDIICDKSMKNEDEWFSSLATLYLIAEIEYYLKSHNKYTDENWVVRVKIPEDVKINSKKHWITAQLNQFKDIMPVYIHENTNWFAKYLDGYDNNIEKYWKTKLVWKYSSNNEVTGEKIKAKFVTKPLSERISEDRNAIMHGTQAHYANNLIFQYIMLHSIMFLYNQEIYNDISIPQSHDLVTSPSV
jgi:hypothetical protein